jgi:O-antigen ligase
VGPGESPLAVLALWKEILLLVILLVAAVEWFQQKEGEWSHKFTIDRLDWFAFGLGALAVLVTLMTSNDLRTSLYGFRYDFIPLIAFVVLRRVEWSRTMRSFVEKVLILTGAVVALVALLTFFLPQSVFTTLGYSDLHSLYVPGAPLAAFQQIEAMGLRRVQGTFAGPNQLGLWLIIPIAIVFVRLLKVVNPLVRPKEILSLWTERASRNDALIFVLLCVALLLTFSRTAWIAAFVIVLIAMFLTQSARDFRRSLAWLISVVVAGVTIVVIFIPSVLLRVSSSWEHIARPLEAIEVIREHPLGLGLGSAGPAQNRVSDACVHLPEGGDASWAVGRTDLCVFVGEVQVQPIDRACDCPLLPENWYLQIGIELGILGLALFLALLFSLLWRLKTQSETREIFLIVLGLSIAGLLLHAWEDSAVAYSMWILAAMVVGPRKD